MTRTRFAGLILGGGEGRRFGGPKAYARLPDGRTFLESCVAVLGAAGARPVAATLPPGQAIDEVPGLRALPLPGPGFDMLASLRWGLRHLVSDPGWVKVVVLPVDHPLVRPVTVTALAGSTAEVAVPVAGGKHGHPLCLSRRVAEDVAWERLPGHSVREVLGEVGVTDVAVDDPGIHANCNTPGALARFWSALH